MHSGVFFCPLQLVLILCFGRRLNYLKRLFDECGVNTLSPGFRASSPLGRWGAALLMHISEELYADLHGQCSLFGFSGSGSRI